MTKKQQNHMHPGALKSCLIPFTDQIFDWWYEDHLSVAEIRRRLIEQGMTVSDTTISRFIKVRERRAQTRIRPEALKKSSSTPKPPPAPLDAGIDALLQSPSQRKPPAPIYVTPPPATNSDTAEGEDLLQYLRTTTPQQLGREAAAARDRLKKQK